MCHDCVFEYPLSYFFLGPFTVFGPTNKAFEVLPKHFTDRLVRNSTLLKELIRYHVVTSTIEKKDFKNDMLLPSMNGMDIRINIYDKVGSALVNVVLCSIYTP